MEPRRSFLKLILLLFDNNNEILHFKFLEVIFVFGFVIAMISTIKRKRTKLKSSKQVKLIRRKHIVMFLSTMRSFQ